MIVINILFLIVCCYCVKFAIENNGKEFYYRLKQSAESLCCICVAVFSFFMSFNTRWLNLCFDEDNLTVDGLLYMFFVGIAGLFYIFLLAYIISNFTNSPIIKLVSYYKNINGDNIPKISYSLFKKMFLLHPDYFRFEYPYSEEYSKTLLSVYYHEERISFRFIDYLLMVDFVRRFAKEDGHKKNNKKESKIYKLMQEDLEKDRIKAEEDTEKALKEVKEASISTIEIINRIKAT